MVELDDDEKLIRNLYVSGQQREVWTINEPGLYFFLARSNKNVLSLFKSRLDDDEKADVGISDGRQDRIIGQGNRAGHRQDRCSWGILASLIKNNYKKIAGKNKGSFVF